MGTENFNDTTGQDRNQNAGQGTDRNADQASQGGNQTQDGQHNFDRQQNQQGGGKSGDQSGNQSGGQAGQTDPNRDRQSGNSGVDDNENGLDGTTNPGQQH